MMLFLEKNFDFIWQKILVKTSFSQIVCISYKKLLSMESFNKLIFHNVDRAIFLKTKLKLLHQRQEIQLFTSERFSEKFIFFFTVNTRKENISLTHSVLFGKILVAKARFLL